MNPSEIFILRPVATTLLMVAILLAGMFAYNFLPLSALPEVDYRRFRFRLLSRASPQVMTSAVTAPLERQFGQMPGSIRYLGEFRRASVITLQFNLDLSLDIAEQEVQAAINAGAICFPGPSGAAGLRQGQSGGRADHDAGCHVEVPAADRNRRPRRNPSGAKAVAAARRRPCQHKWRPAPAIRIQFNPGALAAYG